MAKNPSGSSDWLSANSKHVKNFRLAENFKGFGFLVLFLAFGGVFYILYTNQGDPANIRDSVNSIAGIFGHDETPAQPIDDRSVAVSVPPSSPDQTNAQDIQPITMAPSTNNASGSANAPVTGMPQGVVDAIASLESRGVKNNPYVHSTINTSSIPSDATIKFDKTSWNKTSASSGTIKGTIISSQFSYSGLFTFSQVDGIWKAVAYSLR